MARNIAELPRDQRSGKPIPLKSSEYVQKYRAYLKAMRSKETAHHYAATARRFELFLTEKGYTITNAPPSLFSDFAVSLIESGLKPRSVRAMVAAVKNYLHWLSGRVSIPDYRTPDLPRAFHNKSYTPIKKDIDAYVAMVLATVRKEPARTVLLLLPHCGLRISEICRLTLKSINRRKVDGVEWTFFSVVTKGGDEKNLPMLTTGDPILGEYLWGWRASLGKRSKWLFPGNGSAHITPDCIRGYMNGVRELIDLPNMTPHAIRRFLSTYLVELGNTPQTVSWFMGHKSSKTTEIHYINPKIDQVLKSIKT